VTKIGELGTTLAVTSNRRTLRRNNCSLFLCGCIESDDIRFCEALAKFYQTKWHHIAQESGSTLTWTMF
jgi:hypothetical protein